MLKLKNCPHCGGEVMLCRLNTMVSVAEFSIVCTECGLETRIYANPMANCCFDMGEAKNGTGETGRADSMRRSPGVRMKCNKDCIANVCGECAVEKCEGQIQRLGMRNNNAETAAWTYKIAVDSFKDYFGKKDADQ